MNYRKYPNPIDKYRVSYFKHAVIQKQDHEIRDVFVAYCAIFIAVAATIISFVF